MRLLKFLLPLLLLPQFAFAAYAVPLSATTTTGTIFAFPTKVNNINPVLMSSYFFATSTTGTSTFLGPVKFVPNSNATDPLYIGTSTSGYPIFGAVQGDMIDAEYNFNGVANIGITNDNQGGCAAEGFFANGNIPVVSNNYAFFGFLNSGWNGSGCAVGNGTERPLSFLISNPTNDLNIELSSTTQNSVIVTGKNNVKVFSITNDTGLASTTLLTISGIAVGATRCLQIDSSGIVGVAATACNSGGSSTGVATTSFAATYPITLATSPLITYSFSGLSTTSPWTVGQVAYVADGNHLTSVATGTVSAGSSAITATANRYVLGGALSIDCATATGSQNGCLSSTDWTTFNSKSGFAYPFSYLINPNSTFATSTDATSTSIWTKGVFFSSSTVQANQFPYASTTAITAVTASTTNLFVSGPATTTFANGIDLAPGVGCFSISGSCLQQIVTGSSAYKQAVKYASTSTLPANTYNNGVNGVGATITATPLAPLFIDGNTAALGDRVLVKNEGTGANNGIYTVTTVGVGGVSAFVLTRATDYNSSLDVFPGVANFVNSGTTNANTCWILTNTTAVTIGTTALTYDDACGGGSFSGTAPIVVTGTVISCTVATASVPGCIAAADWNTFSGKVATSSSETAADIPFWTTTSALIPKLSGGDSTFTFTSATKALVFLNGTSTNFSATGSFFTPTATTPSLGANGAIAVTTTAASSSIQVFSGGQFGVYATDTVSFTWSTSSPPTAATDTIAIVLGPRGQTFNMIACRALGGTATVGIGTGVATSTYFPAVTGTPSPAIMSSAFQAWQTLFIAVGTYSATTVTQVSCGLGRSYSY